MVSIIVPCYNEARTIEKIIYCLRSLSFRVEIIIVDDASTDGTQDFLRNRLFQSVNHIIYHFVNCGKGAAIRSGLAVATGDIIAIQDADLEYNPADLEDMIQPLLKNEAEVVYGSRFKGRIQNMKSLYFLGNKFLTWLTNLFTGLQLTDMETGSKAFKAEAIKNIQLTQNRFGFEPEITLKMARGGYRIKEIPISYEARCKEEGKKLSWKDGFNALFCIVRYAYFF